MSRGINPRDGKPNAQRGARAEPTHKLPRPSPPAHDAPTPQVRGCGGQRGTWTAAMRGHMHLVFCFSKLMLRLPTCPRTRHPRISKPWCPEKHSSPKLPDTPAHLACSVRPLPPALSENPGPGSLPLPRKPCAWHWCPDTYRKCEMLVTGWAYRTKCSADFLHSIVGHPDD